MNKATDGSLRVTIIVGTRPEAIKLASLIHEMRKSPHKFRLRLLATGQHTKLLTQALGAFGLTADRNLGAMDKAHSMNGLLGRMIEGIDHDLTSCPADLVIVQGDTLSAWAGAQAAFLRRVPIAHIEAGLRSGNIASPFPEEANRQLIARVAALHFVPTERAAAHLYLEGIDHEAIAITGNTVIDALQSIKKGRYASTALPDAFPHVPANDNRLVLVTSHRRDSFGAPLHAICTAVKNLVAQCRDVEVLFPVHPNPRIYGPVNSLLGQRKRIHLTDALDYVSFLQVLKRAFLVMTDSGGIQEEAPSFGVPVLIMRPQTERSEIVENHYAKVVGVDRDQILHTAQRLMTDEAYYESLRPHANNPFGDGRAARRIVFALNRWRDGIRPLLPRDLEFHPDRL